MFSITPVIMMMIMYWLLMKNIQHECNDDGDEKPLENYSRGWYMEKRLVKLGTDKKQCSDDLYKCNVSWDNKIINNQLNMSP